MENKLEDKLGSLCTYLFPEESKPAIDTLLKIIKNALDNPNAEKYRQLRLSNKIFYQQVWRHSAAQEFLTLVGWTVKEEKLVLQSDEHLQEAYIELRKAQDFIADQNETIKSWFDLSEEEKKLKEQLQLPDDHARTFIEKLRKYGKLLPQCLREYHVRFVRMHEVVSSLESYHEMRKRFPVFRQDHVGDFQKVLELIEERHNLQKKQSNSEINEFQSIEKRLGQLAKEELALKRLYEKKNIEYLLLMIEVFPNEDQVKDQLRECEERLKSYDTPAKTMPDTEPLDFSRYVSSLPDSLHEFLDKQLDWDHDGVDVHLDKIAYHMKDWETKLSSLLGLSDIDIDDLKALHPKPILLRRAV